MTTRPSKNQPRPGQDEILSYLRTSIIEGALHPGDQMPPQSRVIEKFGVSPLTVTRAFKRLDAEGFIRTVHRVGTFVADRPPHLVRYALIFPDSPLVEAPQLWSRHFQALVLAANAINRAGSCRVEIYSCDGHTDSEDYQRLMRDLSQRSLAGLMFAFRPYALQGTAIMDDWGIPRVALGLGVEPMPTIGHNTANFMERAVRLLKAQGRQRVGVITPPLVWQVFFRTLKQVFNRHHMTSLPFWTQAVDVHQPMWVRHAVHAIFHSGDNLAPDALIVTDDHLVEPVADALTEFNIRVPQDVAVVGHWNFPLCYKRAVPIQLLGWDAAELLNRWIDAIDAQRQGKRIAARSVLQLHLGADVITPRTRRSPRRTDATIVP